MTAFVFFVIAASSFAGIHVVRRRVHVHEDRFRPAPADRLGGGDEGVRHGDHLVPGPDPKAQQGQPEGVRAAADPGGELRPAERGELLLELGDERAAREGGLVEHLLDRVRDLPADRLVLGFQVQEGYFHFFFSSVIFRKTFAGFPATIVPGGTSFVTTLPAPDDRLLPHRHAGEDRRAGADRGAFLDERRDADPVRLRLEPASFDRGPGVHVVDEGDVVADEDVVLDRHPLADEGVAGDLAVPADLRALLDLDEGADLAVVADLAAVEVDEVVHLHPFAELHGGGDLLQRIRARSSSRPPLRPGPGRRPGSGRSRPSRRRFSASGRRPRGSGSPAARPGRSNRGSSPS